jgi:hypothetical protein
LSLLPEDCTDERAAIANRLDRNLDLALALETIKRILDPSDRHRLSG